MITIPIKVLARYLRANTTEQQALLRSQKYPTPDLLTALRYHNRARSMIPAFHRGELSLDQIEAAIVAMRAEARSTSRFKCAELMSNADILNSWIAHHGHRRLVLRASTPFELRRTDVEVRAKPNMVAAEHGVQCLIFFAFGTKAVQEHMRLVAQLAFEVLAPWRPGLRLREIQIVNRLGTAVVVERRSPSLAGEIAIACNAISKSWPGIQPPPDGQTPIPTCARGARELGKPWKLRRSCDPDFDGDAHWRERGPEQLQSFFAKRENSAMPAPTNIPTATSWIASITLSSRNRGLVKALSRTMHPNSTKAIDAYILGFFLIPKL